MKIVSYNVNGLRPRVAQHGSLLNLLNSLGADIICFQETKLSRQDLSGDLTMAEGYEAFFSCIRMSRKGRTCYSGVATFCRVNSAFSSNEVSLPVAAEEGFTGFLEHSKKKDAMKTDFFLEGLEEITFEDVLKVDSEGRCIITDHGHFVLFNIYGPNAQDDNKDRLHFKFLFFKLLQKRLESLLRQGRRVFVVGDLNIAPAAIDKCDAEPCFEENQFRKWLRSLLMENGGPFFDVFRSKHPERKEAYTCFQQKVGAEEFNYGSRIDHILIAGPCLHQNADTEGHNFLDCHVKECDILTQFKRWNPDNMPKWKGGRSIKLEGSDHIPVYVLLSGVPNVPLHSTPSLAVRYIPEVHGWQQKIVSLLMKRQVLSGGEHHGVSPSSAAEDTATANCSECIGSSQNCGASKHKNFTSKSEAQGCGPSVNAQMGRIVDETKNTLTVLRSEKAKLLSICHTSVKKKVRLSSGSQRTIRSFFQQNKALSHSDADTINTATSHIRVNVLEEKYDISSVTEDKNPSIGTPIEGDNKSSRQMHDSSGSPHSQDHGGTNICPSSRRERDALALLEWQRIQQKMQNSLPLCRGHGEPCVARTVKKAGPNIGRGFYVCARAKGPASNPEANCGYFKWASVKSRRKRG